jgi:hypothetical protein
VKSPVAHAAASFDASPRTSALGDVEVVLADSRLAYNYAVAQGVPREALLRTASPALALARDINVEPLEQAFTREMVAALDTSTLPFSRNLYEVLENDPALTDFALVVARASLMFQVVIYKAMALREEDFTRSIAVVSVETESTELDQFYNAPWTRILASNGKLHHIEVPSGVLPQMRKGSHVNTSFRDRLKFEAWQSIAYRGFRAVLDRLSLSMPRGTVLIQSENALLKEAAFQLLLRGFGLKTLALLSKTTPDLSEDLAEKLVQRIWPVVHEHLAQWLCASAIEPLIQMFMERALDAAGRYTGSLPKWRQALDAAGGRSKGVLANYPISPEQMALFKVCRERGLPLISAQHGNSREINVQIGNARAYYENNSADVFLTYSKRAAVVSNDENMFAVGRAVPAGMPASLLRAGAYRRRNTARPPVFYVSTLHYMGNQQLIQSSGRDYHRVAYEMSIIDNVLAQLPHRVLYKPYPAYTKRYLDEDPILENVDRAENITLYEDRVDLRYLLPDCRVLITSRGTSTVGFCLVSGKPLVYIDIPDQVALRPEVREAFEKSIFLFDGGSPDLHRDLLEFLSRPLDDIEAQWREMAPAREAMIETFIASGGKGAGRRAADYLVDHILG